MAVRRLAAEQPADFVFTPENLAWAQAQIAKYPEGRQASAVISLLWKAQEQHDGWLPEPAIRYVAEMLAMAHIRVLEVATFYTMFNLEPVGRHYVQLCGTTPCLLRGADKLREVCQRVIGPEKTVTEDGQLSWAEVECLGACANAPMAQINFDYFEDLSPEILENLIGDLRADRPVKPGPQIDRPCSGPAGGITSLLDESLYDGSRIGAWRQRFGAAAGGDQAPTEAARPKVPSPGERQASDTPGERAAAGKEPIKPEDRKKAARGGAGKSVEADAADREATDKGEGLKAVDGAGDKSEAR